MSSPAVNEKYVQDTGESMQQKQHEPMETNEENLKFKETPSKTMMSFTAESPRDLSLPRAPPTGSWISGVFHLITVMIGGGVLSLPSSMALLGWGLGPVLLVVFGAATIWSAYMLADIFETPDGSKHYTYKGAVATILGGFHPHILATIQYLNMFLAAVGYTLAGMTSIEFIAKAACGYQNVKGTCPMTYNAEAILVFSAVQLVLNMCPNLDSVWWVSMLGAGMSYLYSSLAVILSAKSLADFGPADTTPIGVPADTTWLRTIGMFGALGNFAFAWSSGLMIPSIQATLKEPPKAVVSMRKTIIVSYASTGMYYCLIAFLGYAALGSSVPGDVLTGFSVSKAVEVLANAAVLGHMLAAVQVYMHPIYEAVDLCLDEYAPRLAGKTWIAYLVRFIYRSLWTCLITGVGYGLPHFSLISGLNGAVTYWPLQIYYPFAMFLKVYPETPKNVRLLMHVVSAFLLVVAIVATMGSIYSFTTINGNN
ncbi:hypothetical protein CEUSTIGMA_g9935.t1 [Chlamydomonas eustigma]|uniref:Amino acid transporter transmembrane domain-containing protein n=1 Tax=Chlamydomonas eustigma TaxID=1157962 RepID=A0A250XHF8_9CHLO|nr:hypothetical protein CEUSTIGMA_g9935.t1 [Chlamydomonas eustigma]|eukprot:GAX82508.1 hypothetical protein CEUSTIGMA_g9935.t1 [Chlamydomonas eustigma]